MLGIANIAQLRPTANVLSSIVVLVFTKLLSSLDVVVLLPAGVVVVTTLARVIL